MSDWIDSDEAPMTVPVTEPVTVPVTAGRSTCRPPSGRLSRSGFVLGSGLSWQLFVPSRGNMKHIMRAQQTGPLKQP